MSLICFMTFSGRIGFVVVPSLMLVLKNCLIGAEFIIYRLIVRTYKSGFFISFCTGAAGENK